MLGSELVSRIKVKLNRLDTNAYQDVRQEEVLFFAYDALKALTLEFDKGEYSNILDNQAIQIYLGSLSKHQTELPLVSNEADISPTVLKYKDVEAYVVITTPPEEGWSSASRLVTNEKSSSREGNPFTLSFPDEPTYRFIDGKIKFDATGFTCTKYKYDYLVLPEPILLTTDLTYTFLPELENKTVTLILENLEARRLQTQPPVSRS